MSAKEFLRYGEVVAALDAQGIGRKESRQLIALNVIKGKPLRKGGRDYYRWSQIERDVLSESQATNGKNGK